MKEERRMGLWLQQKEHIRSHLWHRHFLTVNQVMKYLNCWRLKRLSSYFCKIFLEITYKGIDVIKGSVTWNIVLRDNIFNSLALNRQMNWTKKVYSCIQDFSYRQHILHMWGCRGHDRMVVGFTTIYSLKLWVRISLYY